MLFDISFDLDGVLADTFEANRLAYEAVGVEMPRWAWGKPWTAWLEDGQAHDAKQEIYRSFLMDHLRELAGTNAAQYFLAKGHHVGVISNASFQSAIQVLGLLDLEVNGLLCGNKIADLAITRPKCHVDDQFVATGTYVVPYVEDCDQVIKMVEAYL